MRLVYTWLVVILARLPCIFTVFPDVHIDRGRQAGKLTKVKNVGNSKQKDLVAERPPPEGETSGHFVRANGEL